MKLTPKWLSVLVLFNVAVALYVFADTEPKTLQSLQEEYYRSYAYERIGDYENAIKSIMPIYQKYPIGYTVNLRLGWLYYLRGAYANSKDHYAKAMKILPNSNDAKLGYSLNLVVQRQWEEVEKLMYQILNIDYYNYYANLRLSYVLRMQGKHDLAEKVIDKMLLLLPTDVSFLSERALVKIAQGDRSTTTEIYNDILILDPENVAAKTFLTQQSF